MRLDKVRRILAYLLVCIPQCNIKALPSFFFAVPSYFWCCCSHLGRLFVFNHRSLFLAAFAPGIFSLSLINGYPPVLDPLLPTERAVWFDFHPPSYLTGVFDRYILAVVDLRSWFLKTVTAGGVPQTLLSDSPTYKCQFKTANLKLRLKSMYFSGNLGICDKKMNKDSSGLSPGRAFRSNQT